MKSYIPKTKEDINAVKQLDKMTFTEISQDINALLEWTQDMHWDVAKGIADYLANYIDFMDNELIEILKSKDEIWKYNVLYSIVFKSNNNISKLLRLEIQRIAYEPTKQEIEEEIDLLAIDVLNKFPN
jgi:hypothetical protein